jgi:hypothetical protein
MEHLRGHHFMVGDKFMTVVKFGFHHHDAQVYQINLNAGKCVVCEDNYVEKEMYTD